MRPPHTMTSIVLPTSTLPLRTSVTANRTSRYSIGQSASVPRSFGRRRPSTLFHEAAPTSTMTPATTIGASANMVSGSWVDPYPKACVDILPAERPEASSIGTVAPMLGASGVVDGDEEAVIREANVAVDFALPEQPSRNAAPPLRRRAFRTPAPRVHNGHECAHTPTSPHAARRRSSAARRRPDGGVPRAARHRQNDYVGWIERARHADTRERRLTQMLAELAASQGYMNMQWWPSGSGRS